MLGDYISLPILCQNSAFLKSTIDQQLSACVCDRCAPQKLDPSLIPQFRPRMVQKLG